MEIVNQKEDLIVFCVLAKSFPEGVLAAHQELHALAPYSEKRKYFGISCPDKTGTIIYKAAMTELQSGELSMQQMESFVIKKGKYLNIVIKDFVKDTAAIGKAFNQLIIDPRIDPQGVCVEWYVNDKDVHCMVRMKNFE